MKTFLFITAGVGVKLALLLALVSRGNERQANVPMCGGRYSVRAALCITFGFGQWRA
ncbi:MAG: hypothetical protein KF687_06390 [Cyclobacteriaceae bacterium]|nr:hypothetical protein [Cyclobacteriaceae bacterium]